MNKKKTISFSLIAIIAVVCFAFYAPSKITVKGSDTMVILSQKWAEIYMKAHPEVAIQVTGGGSGVGIAALINGTTDIANASRPIKPSEVQKLKDRYNTLGVQIACAKDGITIYVNNQNSIKELSMQQLNDIYTGKVTNWKQVGGADAEIKVYGRENSSGTYVYFKEHVLNDKDFVATCQTLPGTAAVVNAVKKDKLGIGYGGAAYAEGVKHLPVKPDDKSAAVEPTADNVKSGKYPISRYLYMYLKTKPTGDLKNYIDWILSPEGQKVVTEVGYFPIK